MSGFPRKDPDAGSARRPVRVRPLQESDLDAVHELSAQLGYPSDRARTHERVRGVLRSPIADGFVAEDGDGRVVGWAHVFMAPYLESGPNAELGGLVVAEAARGGGIGRALVARVEEWGRQRGAAELCLRSNVIRGEAHEFYKRLGFENQKTQHKFRKELGGSRSATNAAEGKSRSPGVPSPDGDPPPEHTMRTYVLVFLYRGPNQPAEREMEKLQRAHLANIARLHQEGKIILAGPFLDKTDLRGIFLFDSESADEVKALCDSDPMIQSGVFRAEIHPWYSAKGIGIALPPVDAQ